MRSAKSSNKILKIGIIVAAVLAVAVVGLVLWSLFRPALPGDYRKVETGAQLLIDKHDIEVAFQVTQVARDGGQDLANTQGKVDLMISKMDEFLDDVDALKKSKVFADPQVGELYQPVETASQDLRDFLASWGESVVSVKKMQEVCLELDGETAHVTVEKVRQGFESYAAGCRSAAEVAKGAQAEARLALLDEKAVIWEQMRQAREGGFDREAWNAGMRADAQATRTWREADEAAASQIATDLSEHMDAVNEALEVSLIQYRAHVNL